MQHSPIKIEFVELIAKNSFVLSSELGVSKYVHVEFCPINKLRSSSRPPDNNFFTTECVVFLLLQRLTKSGSTNQVRNLFA